MCHLFNCIPGYYENGCSPVMAMNKCVQVTTFFVFNLFFVNIVFVIIQILRKVCNIRAEKGIWVFANYIYGRNQPVFVIKQNFNVILYNSLTHSGHNGISACNRISALTFRFSPNGNGKRPATSFYLAWGRGVLRVTHWSQG
jgi:hypothetical protein